MIGSTTKVRPKTEQELALAEENIQDLERFMHEMEAQRLTEELNEALKDLEAERAARVKAEKQTREMNDELDDLKNELLDSLDSTKTLQELRTAREKELASLKKRLEDETANHEAAITEMRHKHSHNAQGLNEQLDEVRKNKTVLEEQKDALEAAYKDLQAEMKLTSGNKQEADRKRKQLEKQCAELRELQATTEQRLQEDREKMFDITNKLDQMSSALAKAEAKASHDDKSSLSLEAELNEANALLEGDHNSDSDFEFRPDVAVESRNRNRLSIGDEIQQMNLPISQTPLHDLEFRYGAQNYEKEISNGLNSVYLPFYIGHLKWIQVTHRLRRMTLAAASTPAPASPWTYY